MPAEGGTVVALLGDGDSGAVVSWAVREATVHHSDVLLVVSTGPASPLATGTPGGHPSDGSVHRLATRVRAARVQAQALDVAVRTRTLAGPVTVRALAEVVEDGALGVWAVGAAADAPDAARGLLDLVTTGPPVLGVLVRGRRPDFRSGVTVLNRGGAASAAVDVAAGEAEAHREALTVVRTSPPASRPADRTVVIGVSPGDVRAAWTAVQEQFRRDPGADVLLVPGRGADVPGGRGGTGPSFPPPRRTA